MLEQGCVLAAEANKGLLTSLNLLLKKNFSKVLSVGYFDQIRTILETESVDVLILDINGYKEKEESIPFIEEIKRLECCTEIVILATFAEIETAVKGVKSGAFDFVIKPWNNEKLILSIRNALAVKKYKQEAAEVDFIKEALLERENYFWGISTAMEKVYDTVHKVADSPMPVLISGEYGVGKRSLAKEIHFISERRNSFCAIVDLDKIADGLFCNELFGVEKGTDGLAPGKVGKIELARNGTLIINRIEKLSMPDQLILLNAIETNKYKRTGGHALNNVSARFICTACKDLEQMTIDGSFNKDLYDRIKTIQISVPSLICRKDDIIPMAKILLERYSRKYDKEVTDFTADAKELLSYFNWQGNVSELAVTIEKAVILSSDAKLSPCNLFLKQADPEDVHSLLGSLFGQKNGALPETLEEMEIRVLKEGLARNNGNMTLTAQQLGITRQTLYNKGKKFRLID